MKVLKRSSPSTIQDKFLVGYQGWFTCQGDGPPIHPGHSGWLHWFDGDRPNVDVWPDVSSYSPSELFPARDLKLRTGEQAFLFSSRHPKTVQKHFHWMAEHGIDGAFLQRFAEQCLPGHDHIRGLRDEVGKLVREAAEQEGRVFAIMYDVSSVPANQIQEVLERDWIHLIRNLCVLDSPNYLKEKGKPVIGLWGFGFEGRGHTPELLRAIIKFFRKMTPGGAYIFGGVPSCWRISEGDADRHPEFVDVWLNECDAISPWTIGRYKNEEEASSFAESKMKGDMELIRRRNEETGRKVDYVPVVYPGGSGFNLSKGNWSFNDAPRMGGRFLWKQIFNTKRLGVRSFYGAMWDEYDEGTAFMPIVTHKRNLPQSDLYRFMALDEEGYDLPSDWYMRICGMAAEGLRSERWIHETFPLKELQDYWSSRPKYEEIETHLGAGPSSSSSKPQDKEDGQAAYQEWLSSQKQDKNEAPPPPYTLLGEETSPSTSAQTQQAVDVSSSSTSGVQSSYGTTVPVIAQVADPLPGQVSRTHSHVPPPSISVVESSGPTSQVPPLTTSPSQSFYAYEELNKSTSVPIGHRPPLSRPHSRGPLPGSNDPGSPQVPKPASDVLALSNNFSNLGVAGSPPHAGIHFDSGADRRPSTISPPPLHPAHPAANKPARPSISRPSTTQQSLPPAGPWAAGDWPPKEWGVTPKPTNGGANLGRVQTFAGSSNSGGANLRPSATISGPPPLPTHSRPNMRPRHESVSRPPDVPPPPNLFPQIPPPSTVGTAAYPPAGFADTNTHSPTNDYGYNYGPGASSAYHAPYGYPQQYPQQQHYNPDMYMPSSPPTPPFHAPHASYSEYSMPAPWMPSGPVSPIGPGPTNNYLGPTYPVGPMGSVGPNSMHTSPMYPPQYGPGTPGMTRGGANNNGPLGYALSAVDMVAGRKTRNQLEGFANKFMK